MRRSYLGCIATAALFAQPLAAQMLSNQGALISVSGGFMSVHGDALNDNDGTFHNKGTIHLTGDWTNNANNEAFVSIGTGVVRLQGYDQRIGGSSITRFYDLILENQGIKYGDINVYVDGFLRLNDREMRMDTHVVSVFNPDLVAVEHSNIGGNWGFVSALGEGGLLRRTNSTQSYFYPVGSALAPARLRPLRITPQDANSNDYRVRLANTDPNNESWDRAMKDYVICDINPSFYHRIAHPVGGSAATLAFYYDGNADGDFTTIGKWTTLNRWQEKSAGTASTDATYGLDVLTSQVALSDFAPTPYALMNVAPNMEISLNANPICADDTLVITANGDFPLFDFYVDTTLVQSAATNVYGGLLPAGNHLVWAMGDLAGVCGRYSDTLTVEVLPAVVAQASPDTIIVEGTQAHLYASGGDFYEWTPTDLVNCSICNETMANPTTSTSFVVLVTNIEGCSAVDTVFVQVSPNAGEVIFIPNALTPNGDGKNDTWFIRNLDLFPENSVTIVNRWGDVVFKADNYNNQWDGDYAGGRLPSGTYYYILNLGGTWGIFKGDVTVVREAE